LLEGFFGTLSPVVKTMRWLLVCLICLLGFLQISESAKAKKGAKEPGASASAGPLSLDSPID